MLVQEPVKLSKLVADYRRLPPAEKLCVQTLSVIYHWASGAQLLPCLHLLGHPVPLSHLHAMLRRLCESGLLVELPGQSQYRCHPSIVGLATKDVVRGGQWRNVAGVVSRNVLMDGEVTPRTFDHHLRGIRMAFYGQDVPKLNGLLAACKRSYPTEYAARPPLRLICGSPFDEDLINALPGQLAETAVQDILGHAERTLKPAHAALAWLESRMERGTVSARYLLGTHYILRGRYEEAEGLAGSKSSRAMLQLRGWLAFLRGDVEVSLEQFEAALALLRRDSMSKVFFPDVGGLAFIAALIKANRLREAREYLAVAHGVAGSPLSVAYRIWNQVAVLHQGGKTAEPIAASETMGPGLHCLTFFYYGLLEYWRDPARGQRLVPSLEKLRATAADAGYEGIAGEVASLLRRMAGSREVEPGRFHLVDLIPWTSPWEGALAKLLSIGQEAADDERMLSRSLEAAPDAADTRLCWFVETQRDRVVSLEPREQRRAAGAWTPARPVALKRLHGGAERLPYLSAGDRQACRCIRAVPSSSGMAYRLDVHAALPALVLHPLVFSAVPPHPSVQILRGEPELRVTRTARGDIVLSLWPDSGPGKTTPVLAEGASRCRVYEFTKAHRDIVGVLGTGLEVPARETRRVAEVLSVLASVVTVSESAQVGVATLPELPADSRIFANLVPSGPGLKLQFVVQPLGPGGPSRHPGSGAVRVVAEEAGECRWVVRDLEREASTLLRLLASCPSLERADPGWHQWTLHEVEDCLELLSDLYDLSGEVTVQWPAGQPFKLVRKASWSDVRLHIRRERDWFAVQGNLQLDDGAVVDMQRLLAQSRQAIGRFVPLGDGEFLALTELFFRRLEELRACCEDGRFHPLAAPAMEQLASGVASLEADAAWKRQLRSLTSVSDIAVPPTLQAELRPYQQEGVKWLGRLAQWGAGACLADDMGLGKTVQALALIAARAAQGPTLVVAPASVCPNWVLEARRFVPALRALQFGPGDRREMMASLSAFDLVVASYGLLHQESNLLSSRKWCTVVLDEAQAIKNSYTRRSQAARGLRAGFKMITTGTPVENHLGELWNILDILNPGLLGSLESFHRRFCSPLERSPEAPARDVLRQLIQPFILRRTKSQVLPELPARTEIVLHVEPSASEAAFYEALRLDSLEQLQKVDGRVGHIHILAEITKLRRACCHPKLVLPGCGVEGSKLGVFADVLDELLENEHKALVFSQFVDHLAILRAYLDGRGVSYQYLDGSTPVGDRQQRVDDFQAGKGDVFLISLKAGGVGLNLTAADYVLHMDPWWNPAVEDQASDRAHRIGQQRPVTIYRLIMKGTIEEQIVELHRHKRDLADQLLDGTDTAGRLTAEELLQLLQGSSKTEGTGL